MQLLSENSYVRNPWFSVIICFLLCVIVSPAFSMFYLNRGLAGLGYLFIQVVSAVLIFGFIGDAHPVTQFITPFQLHLAITAVLYISCITHSIYIITSGKASRAHKWFATSTGLLSLLVLPVLVLLLGRIFLFQPFHIPSGSMRPTLLIGDYIFVNKFSYGYGKHSLPFSFPLFSKRFFFSPPKRGDVIVFKKPTDITSDYVKRVVGLPGDSIQIITGKLHINGTPVSLTRIGDFQGPGLGKIAMYKETLPNNVSYFILDHGTRFGDNTIKYTVPEKHYFVLGDNRDQSNDSRNPHEIGFIPEDYIVGPVSVIWWNSKKREFSWKGVFVN